ncbi:MAG: cation diffusion facilitator family transporter [Deferrisomatales bacterium]
MGHGSEHACGHGHGSKRSLLLSLGITVGFMGVEAVGGWLTNSLALLSDAGHMLTDAAALGLSWVALTLGEKPPSPTKTFGYRRWEILAALLNGLALWAIVGVILHEAYERLLAPREIRALGMVAVAALGLGVNLVSIGLLRAHKDENLNVRGAFLHVVADSLGSVGALGAGLVVWSTGWTVADPLISLGICALILWSSWGLVRDSVHVLLLGVPPHLDYHEVVAALLEHEGVCCVYDVHLWSIAPGQEALSAHVVVPDGFSAQKELLRSLVERLHERFGIEHATLQIEESHEMKEGRAGAVCVVEGAPVPAGHGAGRAVPSAFPRGGGDR